ASGVAGRAMVCMAVLTGIKLKQMITIRIREVQCLFEICLGKSQKATVQAFATVAGCRFMRWQRR
ncbi:MAG: hypothetical protein LBE58_08815, partial [Comamonas sp.]|nr:hypothetical protein [Comamonas sp.]